VFGTRVLPGQLIHADKHGFLVIPEEDQDRLLHASKFMDDNECNTVIAAGINTAGLSLDEILANMNDAGKRFREAARSEFQRDGEW